MALPQPFQVVCLPIQYSSWEIYKVLSSFPTLFIFLLLTGVPSKQLQSFVFTGMQRLIIPGWCVIWSKMQLGAGQQSIIKSFSFKSKFLQRFFSFSSSAIPTPDPLPSLQFPGLCNPRQCSTIVIHSHLTQWSSYLNSKSWVFLFGKQTNPLEDPSIVK